MSSTASVLRPFRNAVVVHANYAQLSPGARWTAPQVESRMLLWCLSGKGTAAINGQSHAMEAGRYFFLPWKHRISYQASKEDPFLLGGVHIVPNHATDHRVVFHVAHESEHELAGKPWRRDAACAGLTGVKMGRLESTTPLMHLADYIVRVFIQGYPPEWLARQLALMLLHELMAHETSLKLHDHDVPPELERMKQYVTTNLQRQFSLRDLVEFSGLSASTVGRMYREHLRMTPVEWILSVKLDRAKSLLRTRRLSVSEVAEQVGIPDVYYFSKRFKKATRQSPLEYRKQRGWL